MIVLAHEATRFSTSLLTRGGLMVLLGSAAIGWPDDLIVGAMLAAAVLLAVLGAYEMILALRTRRATPGFLVPMANGAACIGFAILTLAFPGLSLQVTLIAVSIWLVLYATLTGALALALWPMVRTRRVLVSWTVLNIALALGAVTARQATIFTVLYVGAGYAVAFGVLQVAAGMWVRRIAVPFVAPPTQAGWRADRATMRLPAKGASVIPR